MYYLKQQFMVYVEHKLMNEQHDEKRELFHSQELAL